MAKKSDRNKLKKKPREAAKLPEEARRAEALTVAWMLSALLTFTAELLNLGLYTYLYFADATPSTEAPLFALAELAMFSALVAGLITLLLTPAVYTVRKAKPPRTILFIVILISAAPMVTLVLRAFRNSY